MAASKRKLTELSIDKKVEVLEKLSRGNSTRDLAKFYKVDQKTICNIKKNSDRIKELWQSNFAATRKRSIRNIEYEDVDKLSIKFFEICRSKNIPITGPMIQTKAKTIADALGFSEFVASNGWLQKFTARHNIVFKSLSGEANDLDIKVLQDWKAKIPNIIQGYALRDIYNADETGFFYKQLLTKSLALTGEKCSGGKLAKERLTVLFGCSATGEKLIPLVIGKAACPRVFRTEHITSRNLPVLWRSNRKAWMTSDLFTEWATLINRIMKAANRHILLFVDNAPSHPKIELSNVELIFFPPNLTAGAQPLDQGIIQSIKLLYRKELLNKLLYCRNVCKFYAIYIANYST